jgi:hypothetical protein
MIGTYKNFRKCALPLCICEKHSALLQDFGFLEFDFNVQSISDQSLANAGSLNITSLSLLMPITRDY